MADVFFKLKVNGFKEIIKRGEVARKVDRLTGGVYVIEKDDRKDFIFELDVDKVDKAEE